METANVFFKVCFLFQEDADINILKFDITIPFSLSLKALQTESFLSMIDTGANRTPK